MPLTHVLTVSSKDPVPLFDNRSPASRTCVTLTNVGPGVVNIVSEGDVAVHQTFVAKDVTVPRVSLAKDETQSSTVVYYGEDV